MIFVDSKHPPGTVGFITSGGVRYDDFYDCLEQTMVPVGTELLKGKNYNAARNRNCIVEEYKGEWIWFLDDDQTWEPDCLIRLLDRNVDAVTALYCRRYPPFASVIYDVFDPPAMKLLNWKELAGKRGVEKIAAAGAGGLLVRKPVLDAIGDFPFRVGLANGEEWRGMSPDSMQEDTGFCWRLNKAGFNLYVDLDVSEGHSTEVILIPKQQEDGTWSVIANIAGHVQWLFKGER